MICIADHRTDPYFNLAAEEYLLKNSTSDYFMLWQNEPSIVVGKHQNALAEIDLSYAREKGFKVARRISGGGTVFHDLGNLNFSFISTGEEGKLVNYRKFALPVVEVLGKMGIDAGFSKRDDILIAGMKISGNASHVYKKRVLHHGTLLFSSDLSDLSKALKTTQDLFSDKAVKSVRSRVTNICDHLDEAMEVTAFKEAIMNHVVESYKGELYEYSKDDVLEINRLRDEKFATWDWNFGYSPKYKFSKKISLKKGSLGLEMRVVSGKIEEIYFQSDFLGRTHTTVLENILTGTRHDPLFIAEQIQNNEQKLNDMGLSPNELKTIFL